MCAVSAAGQSAECWCVLACSTRAIAGAAAPGSVILSLDFFGFATAASPFSPLFLPPSAWRTGVSLGVGVCVMMGAYENGLYYNFV